MINLFKNRFGKNSYSQSGEDMIVSFIFDSLYGANYKGFYVDIGANHPFELNNTVFFYQRKWHGINIDPIQSNIDLFNKFRKHDFNLLAGIGAHDEYKTFYLMNPSTLSTFDKNVAEIYQNQGHTIAKEYDIKLYSTQSFIKQFVNQKIDLLSVDIEANAIELLEYFSNSDFRPLVIIYESVNYAPKLQDATKNTQEIEKIKNMGYSVYADTFINTIFVDEKLKINRKHEK